MLKSLTGTVIASLWPQCSYERTMVVIGHMRCGSTALSNVLCAHPQISGYGEAHIAYDRRAALGVLVANQARRSAWKPDATYLFDKILHSRYDARLSDGLARGRAIFVVREPHQTIRSIRHLFTKVVTGEYKTDEAVADYYEERLTTMLRLWDCYQPERRVGFTHDGLTANPQRSLDEVTTMAILNPRLENKYVPRHQSPGAGDPLASHRFTSIVASAQSTALRKDSEPLALTVDRLDLLASFYREAVTRFSVR